ncbi:WD40 repeat-like protein [Mycena sanguinolenta]|uniref:WD40 repeat-like protein n=1 Tax=Mycena sanguinolenta TaxID=230812 RepID=A0A8H7DKK6_9AGAR|nr:WD40 repeat-like protein [Mycena sanguinolenta]
MPGIARRFSRLEALKVEHDLFADNAFDDIRRFIENELDADGRLGDIKEFIEDRMGVLLDNSGGLFIYIEVIIKFIAAHGDTKLDVANEILGSKSHAKAETALDGLYRTVIKAAAEETNSWQTAKMISSFVLATSNTSPLDARALHAFLPPPFNIAFKTFEEILKRMSAIFIIGADGVVVIHTSVLDFLGDETRCGKDIFVPLDEVEGSMATGCFEIMKHGTRNAGRQMNRSPSGLRFNICDLETSYLPNNEVLDLDKRITANISAELRYSCLHWLDHLRSSLGTSQSSSDEEEAMIALTDFLESKRSLFWLEVLSLAGNLAAGRDILLGVLRQSSSPKFSQFTLIVSQLRTHVEQCFNAISTSTPHLYLSLTWIATESKLWDVWQADFPKAQILKDPIRRSSRLLLSISCPPRVDTFTLSPNGKHVASGSRDGCVTIWDLVSGALVGRTQVITPPNAFDGNKCSDNGKQRHQH